MNWQKLLLPPSYRAMQEQRRRERQAARDQLAAESRVIPSPNIWDSPDTYEVENESVDPDRLLEAAMHRLAGVDTFAGLHVLDLGCGTGFHLPRWAAEGAQVTGVEPHPPLVQQARERVQSLKLTHVVVHEAPAQRLPLEDASVDIAQARWAYFFGPGCEPGLAELNRVMKPGGYAFVIDNEGRRDASTFSRWFCDAYPTLDHDATARFWHRQGWASEPVEIRWQMRTRAEFEAVMAIEFPAEACRRYIAEDPIRTGVDYATLIRWKRF